jgi:hypothetical protein
MVSCSQANLIDTVSDIKLLYKCNSPRRILCTAKCSHAPRLFAATTIITAKVSASTAVIIVKLSRIANQQRQTYKRGRRKVLTALASIIPPSRPLQTRQVRKLIKEGEKDAYPPTPSAAAPPAPMPPCLRCGYPPPIIPPPIIGIPPPILCCGYPPYPCCGYPPYPCCWYPPP